MVAEVSDQAPQTLASFVISQQFHRFQQFLHSHFPAIHGGKLNYLTLIGQSLVINIEL